MATSRTATAPAFREARILRDATDEHGRYDAAKIAHLLDWTVSDLARYLGRDASTISRFGASPVHQEKLAALASLTQEVFEIMREDLRATRAWFRTPIRALDGKSPQHLILSGNLRRVSGLIEESRSGLAL
jgi:antitoxin Xre/MbcA/ParS-like protein